jgi:glycosyltransferase involved in cell wall biosynthesis
LTALEAMAARLPVVATDVGGMSEVVIHNETGFLAGVGNDKTLAQHLLRLAADPDERERLGLAGRARAKQLFDESRMCDDYGCIYQELAGA